MRLNKIIFYPTENATTEERMFRAGQLHYTNDVPIDKVQPIAKPMTRPASDSLSGHLLLSH